MSNFLTESLESELRKVRESQTFLRVMVGAIIKRYGGENGNLRLGRDWDDVATNPTILTHTDPETFETIVRAVE